MKVTIERKEKVEVEVNLPLFTKDKHHYYMLTENKSIVLFVGEDDYSISVNNYLMQYPLSYDQITEQEFNHTYILLMSKLNSHVK